METDSDLLRRYAEAQSEPAFRELVQRYLNLVYSAALRQTGNAHRAEDVSQLVFIALARQAPRLTGHPALSGWLYTCTHHKAAFHLRSEQRRRVREQEAHAMQAIDSTAAIDWDRIRPVLDNAMHELPERDRHAVLLRYFDRKSTIEIGGLLGLSESAARRLTERALDNLRTRLARRGITSTAAALTVILSTQSVLAAPPKLLPAMVDAALAGAEASATPVLLSGAMKLQFVALAASVVLNLGLVGIGATPSPMNPVEDLAAEQAVSAVSPSPAEAASSLETEPARANVAFARLEGDVTDPEFVGRKLLAEGYPLPAVIAGVRGAAMVRRDAELKSTFEARLEQRTRWRPSVPTTAESNSRYRDASAAADAEANEILKVLLGAPALQQATP